MTYRTYIRVVEKLKIIFSIVFLMTMLYLASQGDRRNYSPTYLEQKVIFEANLEKAIARDKGNLNRNRHTLLLTKLMHPVEGCIDPTTS